MDKRMETLIAGLLDKANDVLDGILARQSCRAPVAVFHNTKDYVVFCDDGTVWRLLSAGMWEEWAEPIPESVAKYTDDDDA